MNKEIFAKGLSDIVRYLMAVLTGAFTYSMFGKKANKLATVLDKACFEYSKDALYADFEVIEQLAEEEEYDNNCTGTEDDES